MTPLRRVLTLPAAGMALLLLGIFFEAFIMLRVTGGVTVGDALILGAGALLAAQALRGTARVWFPPWLLLAIPLLVAGTAVAALSEGRQGRADVIVAIELLFCVVALPVIVASQPADRDVARRLVMAWIAGNLAGAAIAYLQFRHVDLRPLDRWLVWNSGRIAGMTPNPNTLGASLALLAPVCLAFAADARRLVPMAFWVAATLLCLHVIDLTGSRTSLAAVTLGCSVVVVLAAARTTLAELPLRLAQVIGVAVTIAIAWQIRETYHDSAIARLLGYSGSGAISRFFREALYHTSAQAIAAAPFLGYGYSHMTAAAHNVPMALVQGGGLAALAGFLLAQIGMLVGAVRLFVHSRRDRGSRGVAIGMIGVWCTWLALGTYDVSVLNRNAYLAFAFAVVWLGTCRATRPAPATARDLRMRPA